MTSPDTKQATVPADLRSILRDALQIGERAQSLEQSSPLLGAVPELDSLAVVTVVTAIEEHFYVKVEDDEIRADVFETFGSLCDFVGGKLTA
jgi:acyl carrier protein